MAIRAIEHRTIAPALTADRGRYSFLKKAAVTVAAASVIHVGVKAGLDFNLGAPVALYFGSAFGFGKLTGGGIKNPGFMATLVTLCFGPIAGAFSLPILALRNAFGGAAAPVPANKVDKLV